METTEFMMNLEKELMKTRKVAESTAHAYIKSLYALNKKKPFKNLTFLKNVSEIENIIAEYAESTQRGLLATITSVLSMYKDKAGYKKIYQQYHDKMMERVEEKRDEEKEGVVKSKKQAENWLTWDEIQSRKNELKGGLITKKRSVDTAEYDKLLQYVILSLYTEVAPRRNQDYLSMHIVKKWNDKMPNDKNYLDVAGKRFIYNVYKTSKKYGTQIEEIPEPLWETLQLFLKHHPLWKEGKRKTDPVKLLVNADGTPMTAVNAITRLLNKVFDGKKVGSSMLRHIFLTDKYKDTLQEMKKDSVAMAHSGSQQRDYVLKDKVEEVNQTPVQQSSPQNAL